MNKDQVIDYIRLGIEKGLIKILDDGKRIEYVEQKKSRYTLIPKNKYKPKPIAAWYSNTVIPNTAYKTLS